MIPTGVGTSSAEIKKLALEIENCASGIAVNDCRMINSGWDNLVLEVNRRHIFRFPRFRGGWARILKETNSLPLISPKLTVDVPEYRDMWAGSKQYPWKFAGYRKIPGVSCAELRYLNDVVALGRDLGHFLTELHRIRQSDKIMEYVPRYDTETWSKSRIAFHHRVQRLVYPLLDGSTRSAGEEFWGRSIELMSKADFVPTLIHSDMRAGNIILDPTTSRLKGIVDWDNVAVGDPALDFMGAFEVSERLGTEALRSYGRDARGYVDRAKIYLKTVPFGEIAWGVQIDSKRFVTEGMRHLELMLAA